MKKILTILAALAALTSYAQQGLVHEYLFNDSPMDSEGLLDLTVSGATLTDDRFGNELSAYYFDGVDDKLSASSFLLPNGVERSVSVWIKSDDLHTTSSDRLDNQMILASSGGIGVYSNTGTANGILAFFDGSSLNNDLDDSYSHATNLEWTHIVATSVNGETKLYVNNELVSTYSEVLSNSDEVGDFNVGFNSNNSDYFKGNIDDIKVYDRALTECDINTLFTETITVPFMHEFLFSGDANDSKGSLDLVVSGATLTDDRFGNENSAYYFDGVDDGLSGMGILFPSTGERSLSVWIKADDLHTTSSNNLDNQMVFGGVVGLYANVRTANGILALFDGSSLDNSDDDAYAHATNTEWTHIVATSVNDETKVYVNNELVSTYSEDLYNSDVAVAFNVGFNGTYADKFQGNIDDIKLYSKALSVCEIETLFGESSTGTVTDIALTSNTVNVLEVYPNPTSDRVYLNSKVSVQFTLLDGTGRVIDKGNYSVDGVDLSAQKSGIYLIKLNDGNSETVHKLIKK